MTSDHTAPGEAWIFDYVRTPRGKASKTGGLHGVSSIDLVIHLMNSLVERGLDPREVADVVLGSASQVNDQGGNPARVAALRAGWGAHVPGLMVNRFCASGIDAVAVAAARVKAGDADLIVAGGVESVSRVPMFADRGPLWADPATVAEIGSIHMGVAADLNATLDGLDRETLDAYGALSQQRAAAAWADGRFDQSVVPLPDTADGPGLARDEHVRAGTTAESLAQLAPAFSGLGADGQDALALTRFAELDAIDHLHTVGTSPGMADGAALLVIGTLDAGLRAGLRPRARVHSSVSMAGDPVRMLTVGQDAVCESLRRAELSPSEVDVFEFAEAFAALCVRFQRDLGIDAEAGDDRFNPNGGTMAMGHAFGATGAIMIGGCVDELERRDGRWGVAAVSGAAGLGSAVLVERPNGTARAAI
ncbi:acetyl-CoA C-acyltransferase [Gordonia sp. (in: high G+C Gram-positive bacteria)]|uniref:acetyl-CoA C-acyltransferase n=1 Tax=Gordonia sp. (in: high G+C Gram-positive bacteria) TaxID=84139 RepID=UPI0016A2EF45|nr:acetyl-CoA C-acyltransferase [Gordonia sp. (in: high G+C Gram-positive bacteria)]NLG45498.1 acetyl-CoA C-acyltransferase [Gordonia sp. (in: high G+C Gram-positive bacteria)]